MNTLKSTSDDVMRKLMELISERRTESTDAIFEDVNDSGCVRLKTGIISKCHVPGLEDYVLFIKGSGPHTIDYGACTRDKPLKEVIVSRKCAEAVLRGAQVSKFPGLSSSNLVVCYSELLIGLFDN